ncbi:GM22067 [Drosophila sechellia]|uniref:GM22067 n=1 Tax=Drosophila sechellia TaxID=7238 RepID=B4IPI5_DROSE|nr:GM22067 [Drosophila sechellia]
MEETYSKEQEEQEESTVGKTESGTSRSQEKQLHTRRSRSVCRRNPVPRLRLPGRDQEGAGRREEFIEV